MLVANGQLDFQSGLELTTMVKAWVDTQYDRSEYELKLANSTGTGDTTIKIEGGLPPLPGTNVIMPPKINGHGLQELEPPPIESITMQPAEPEPG